MSVYEQDLIISLKAAQEQYATDKGILNPVSDPIKVKEIEEKIEVLFPIDRFYFYKVTDEDEKN